MLLSKYSWANIDDVDDVDDVVDVDDVDDAGEEMYMRMMRVGDVVYMNFVVALWEKPLRRSFRKKWNSNCVFV